jgi:hypothetical protein
LDTALTISQPIGYRLRLFDEVGARPSLPNFVRKREYFTNNLKQGSPKPLKKSPNRILSTKAITKPSIRFFFHFQNQIKENLVTKLREKH